MTAVASPDAARLVFAAVAGLILLLILIIKFKVHAMISILIGAVGIGLMAGMPLADIIGISRQVAVLAFQLGAGFVDAFTPVSASLIGVLGVARIDWGKWAKFQIKFQAVLFTFGSIAVILAVVIGLS